MQITLDISKPLGEQLTQLPDLNQFVEKWLMYGLENKHFNPKLDITFAFGLVKTTQTATLEQIEQAIEQGAIDDSY